ncbi:MAG: hypothetical protein ACRDHX_14565 [Chloroflexota bacterium]
MDDGLVVWDDYNRRHLTEEHPERTISVAEIEEAMSDSNRIEADVQRVDGTYGSVIGRTAAGRLVFIAYIHRDDGRYPVHARQAGQRLARRYDS